MNNCILCNSESIFESSDQGEDKHSCSNPDCSLGQVWFTEQEWQTINREPEEIILEQKIKESERLLNLERALRKQMKAKKNISVRSYG